MKCSFLTQFLSVECCQYWCEIVYFFSKFWCANLRWGTTLVQNRENCQMEGLVDSSDARPPSYPPLPKKNPANSGYHLLIQVPVGDRALGQGWRSYPCFTAKCVEKVIQNKSKICFLDWNFVYIKRAVILSNLKRYHNGKQKQTYLCNWQRQIRQVPSMLSIILSAASKCKAP